MRNPEARKHEFEMNSYIHNSNYAEQVYAGVLGKIIGVYLGRPIEGWPHEHIEKEIGEVDHYLHEERGCQLVVPDDDITGTFTFLRAVVDSEYSPELTPAMIGDSWMNYIIEGRTILWWGGMGTSTEHTAYLRLKHGISAPLSGSIALNGKTVAEQIGAQIFIEGWGLIHPGDPESAADYARRAGSVSHDGEAVYAAQLIAAMTALAFVHEDVESLLDGALPLIPAESTIANMVGEIRTWRESGIEWRSAFQKLKRKYGYEQYGGGCHVVPNHGIVILALLFGGGDFSRSLMIANTCGWDTDCNSANVGSILGVMGGLAGIDAGYDWRGPVRDRIYLPTADGGRCVTDAVRETKAIVQTAFGLHDEPSENPHSNLRFTFDFPGSVQGFAGDGIRVSNTDRRLKLTLTDSNGCVMTPTFPSAEDRRTGGYGLVACPTLSPGQTVRAQIRGATNSASVAIRIGAFAGGDEPQILNSEWHHVEPAGVTAVEYCVPDLGGYPISEVGLYVEGNVGDELELEWLTWDGVPHVHLGKTPEGVVWRDAWVNGVSEFGTWGGPFRLSQNEGTGLLIHGCREWQDLAVESEIQVCLVENAGIAVRVQGMQRYYALRVTREGEAQLIKSLGDVAVLARAPFAWEFDEKIRFHLQVSGNHLRGELNGATILEATDDELQDGAIAFVLTEGRIDAQQISIEPIEK